MSSMKAIALKTDFGIEDLLKAKSRVVFENIFSTRHIGRVMDFFLFEAEPFFKSVNDTGFFEYRFRHALELGIFNAWSNYRRGEAVKCVEVEVGWDESRLVLAFTHSIDADVTGFAPGSTPSNETAVRMQKMLEQIRQLCDGLLVRYSPQSGRVQAIAFLSAAEAAAKEEPEFLEVTPASIEKTRGDAVSAVPEPLSAGKVDAFLADEKQDAMPRKGARGAIAPAAGVGETRVSGVDLTEEDWLKRVAGEHAQAEGATRVGGGKDQTSEELVRLKRDARISSEEAVKIKAGKRAEEDSKVVISGGAGESGELLALDKDILPKGGSAEGTTITVEGEGAPDVDEAETMKEVEENVQLISDSIRGDIVAAFPDLEADKYKEFYRKATETISSSYINTIQNLKQVHKIELEAKVKLYKERVQALSARIDELRLKAGEDPSVDREADAAPIGEIATDVDFDSILSEYSRALEGGDVPDAAKTWARNLIDGMKKERGEFSHRVKEFEAHARKLEFDFKGKETGMKELLRVKDELLRQRELTLEKTKESLGNALGTLEKMRAMEKISDKGELTGKLMTSEKMLSLANENAERASKKLEETHQKWMAELNARAVFQKEVSVKGRLVDDLQRRLEVALKSKGESGKAGGEVSQRVIETLKGQNRLLQDKLAAANANIAKANAMSMEAKRAGSAGGDAESRHKLEQSSKLIRALKEETERFHKKYDEARMSETKLRVEIARLQAQLKAGKR